MTKYLIYGLVDPMTHQLRYIGKSERGLKRPPEHWRPHFLKAKTHKVFWLRQVLAQGLEPQVVTIQELSSKDGLGDAEIFWIAYFKTMGCPLTNHCRGGEGFSGPHSEESKKKMGTYWRGRKRTDETKKRMSVAKTGHTVSDETRAKIAVALLGRPGHKHTNEARAKISASHRGLRASPEARAKMAASARARWAREVQGG